MLVRERLELPHLNSKKRSSKGTMIVKRKNLGATTQHLNLAVMMEAAASTATMMMRTTLEGV